MALDRENETCSTPEPMELEERSRRILEIAVELAEEGGFIGVFGEAFHHRLPSERRPTGLRWLRELGEGRP